jgi:ribulose-phosphate 3-epimerase
MDGHFVPNIALGVETVKAAKRSTSIPLEIHLMVERPDIYWKLFRDAGGSRFLVHFESQADIARLGAETKKEGYKVGIAINPETRFSAISDIVGDFDYLLVMSVHPGFSGQKFIDDVIPKVKESSEFISRNKLKTLIEVDGGVNLEKGKLCAASGANILASASYIFSSNVEERIQDLKSL